MVDPPRSTKQKDVVAASVASPETSEEEEEDEEEEEEEESGSAEDSDDFDSADDRVNQIFPSQSFIHQDDEGSDDEASGESHGARPSVSDSVKQKTTNTNNDSSRLEEEEEEDDDDDDDDDDEEEEEEDDDDDDDDEEEEEDEEEESSSSASEPILSQLSKGSISNNGNAVQNQELKYVANKAQAGDANKAKSGDASKAKSGDASKAKSGDASKAKSGDASKAKSGDASKAKSGDASKAKSGDASKAKSGDANKAKAGDVNKAKSGDANKPQAGDTSKATFGDSNKARVEDVKAARAEDGKPARAEDVKKVRPEDAKAARAEDVKKVRPEDAKAARAEDAKAARAEDAKAARAEDVKKDRVEDTKKPPIEDSKKRKVEDAHSVKKSKKEVSKLLEKELNSTPVRSESRKESSGGKHKEESNAQTGKINKREESDDQQSVRKDELSFVKSGSKRSRDEELGEKSSSKRKRKQSPAFGSEETHEKHIPNEDRKVEKTESVHPHHDAAKEIARKSRAKSATHGNGLMSDRKSLGADNEGLKENKANSNMVPSHSKLKKPHVWSVDEEIFLASEILNHLNLEHEIPLKRNAHFWANLAENMNKKFIVVFTREQLTEKFRRMKLRYQTIAQKVKECQDSQMPYKHKTSSDQRLFDILMQIWGRSEITPLDDKEDVDPPVSLEVGEEMLKPDMVAQSIQMDCDPKHTQVMKNIEIISKSQPNRGLNANGNTDREAKPSLTTPILGNGSPPTVCSLDSHSMQKLIWDDIQTYVNEVNEWSKQSLEDWRNMAMMKIESSVKTLGEHTRQVIGMGNGLMAVPGGVFSRSMDDLQTFGGEEACQHQWNEMQMQQVDIWNRKLQITIDECKLKQQMLNLYPRLKKNEES